MEQKENYYVLAFYCFTPIQQPHEEVAKHHEFFKTRDIRSRIYISHQGINAQMSAEEKDAQAYMEWVRQDPRFSDIDFKVHHYHEHVFPRATVKFRSQLVALDHDADPREGGAHVSPAEWKKMLEEMDEDVILLDVRNDYEWKIGHFEGAIKPELDMFRKFPEYAKKLSQERSPEKTKVMMYCTGGIRCELYSALMKKEGFKHVYQLDGGVIKYGLQEGNSLWKGKLFVFDDRLAVPIDEEDSSDVISSCHHCGKPCDVYYNCANMDCNELFLCCQGCAETHKGCCKKECEESPRLRPYEKTERPKPFRKWYHYENVKTQ
jgi:UPF0176 protein